MASADLDDPPPEAPGLLSVVVTVKNEVRHISDLLDSLLVQEEPWEVLVVDAESTDGTREIVQGYADENKGVRLITHAGTRGESRNVGVERARGDAVAFIDGDCIANPFWLARLRRALADADVASGRTIEIGYWAFENLHRVELVIEGVDVTYPSCNLAYTVEAFEEAGGFDDWFHTAEDIDLNYRAVEAGLTFAQAEDAVVYHRARDSISGFLNQAYWNGYGRKQLTLKHGSLWSDYSFGRMIRSQASFWGLVRLAAASFGYMACKIKEDGYPG
jgi:glycosyltransferase involved in cell wall biosynthesis